MKQALNCKFQNRRRVGTLQNISRNLYSWWTEKSMEVDQGYCLVSKERGEQKQLIEKEIMKSESRLSINIKI